MANHENNRKAMSSASPSDNLRPLHQRHTPLIPATEDDANALFAANVGDVTHGARVLVEIMRSQLINMDTISQGCNARTLLSVNDMDALAGLLETSLGMMYEAADRRVESLNEQARKGVRS